MEILYFQFAASLVIRRPRRAVALLTQCSVFCALVYLLLIFDLFLKIILIKTSFIHPSGSRQSIICKSKSLVTRTIVEMGSWREAGRVQPMLEERPEDPGGGESD